MVGIRPLGVFGIMVCGTMLASCAQSEEASARSQPKIHTVIMEGMVFQPDVITVASGDTIVWVNKDMVPHSATSAAGGFDSKVIQANKSWRHTAQQKGEFDYICSYHPATMKAKLQVR
jgi:plastocyanin